MKGPVTQAHTIPPHVRSLRSDQWTAKPHAHEILGYLGVYVDDLLIAGKRTLNDALIQAVQRVWKTSTPEHLRPDRDDVLVLHSLGMSLERVSENRSQELELPSQPGKLCYPYYSEFKDTYS